MRNGKKVVRSFDKRLADGEIMTLNDAATQSGYSPVHLRRLCFRKKVEHIRRGLLMFFTAAQAEKLVKVVKPVTAEA